MESQEVIVLKFGGASVATPRHFHRVAEIVQSSLRAGLRCVVVVSAMRDATNFLDWLAHSVVPDPPRREYDMLVSVGERVSAALLSMVLHDKGIRSVSLTGSQSGIITTEEHKDARILALHPTRVKEHLSLGEVVVIAGFQGVSREKKNITTLGRGGADTTAAAMGSALGATRVVFYKDVPGIFSADPTCCQEAIQQLQLSYAQALEIARRGGVLHPRCIEWAMIHELPLQVRSFLVEHEENKGTLVCNQPLLV